MKSDIIKCSNNVTPEYASMETNCLLNDTLYVGVDNYKGKIFLCVGTYSGHTNASTGCSVNLILFGSDGNYTVINLLNSGTDYPVYSFTTNGIVYVKRSGGTASSTVYTRLIPIN